MKIIQHNDESFWILWKKLIDSVDYNHPIYSEIGLSFYKEYFYKNEKIKNCSFIILNNNTPIVGAIMSINISTNNNINLSGFGRGINYLENNLGNVEGIKTARKIFKKEFDSILELNNIGSIFYRDYSSIDGSLSVLSRMLLDMGGIPDVHYVQIIDLEKTIESIHSNLSKSCRNSVNWGKNNLDITVYDSKNVSIENINKLRNLHIQEAGRETRSKESWEIMYQMILLNNALLIEGSIDNNVVTSSLFYLNRKVCLYAVSATQRSLFNKPIGHAVLWEAICTAKNLNCKYFDSGGLLYNSHESFISPKQLNINRYKKNFGGETKSQLTIKWDKKIINDKR